MKYGIHTALVEEVIEFVKSGRILKPGTRIGGDDHWTVVGEFDDASSYAWQDVVGEDELLWKDIREREMSEVKSKSFQLVGFSEHRENLSALLKTFTMYLKRQIPKEFEDILDDAISDLYNCAFCRCINGSQTPFFETIFEAYQAGCWPCGWDGCYPDGRLRVFQPSESTHPPGVQTEATN